MRSIRSRISPFCDRTEHVIGHAERFDRLLKR
jgi:hypothetical protein